MLTLEGKVYAKGIESLTSKGTRFRQVLKRTVLRLIKVEKDLFLVLNSDKKVRNPATDVATQETEILRF